MDEHKGLRLHEPLRAREGHKRTCGGNLTIYVGVNRDWVRSDRERCREACKSVSAVGVDVKVNRRRLRKL
jgi:hypothetical protein